MLAVTQLVGFGVGYGPIALNFIGTAGYEATASSHTYSSVPIGTDDPARVVVVCVAWNISGTCSLSSITIGGNAATIIGQCFATGNNQGIAIARLKVPTGTTADIVVNYSGSPLRGEIGVYNLLGYLSDTPYASNFPTGGADASRSATFDVPAGGMALGYTEGGTGSWTAGVDQDFKEQTFTSNNPWHSGAHRYYAAAQTSLSVTYSQARVVCGCSWG